MLLCQCSTSATGLVSWARNYILGRMERFENGSWFSYGCIETTACGSPSNKWGTEVMLSFENLVHHMHVIRWHFWRACYQVQFHIRWGKCPISLHLLKTSQKLPKIIWTLSKIFEYYLNNFEDFRMVQIISKEFLRFSEYVNHYFSTTIGMFTKTFKNVIRFVDGHQGDCLLHQ